MEDLKTDDLQARLTRATEIKTPSAAPVKQNTGFWDQLDNDFEKVAETLEPEAKDDKETTKISADLADKIRKGSASTAVGALNLLNRVLFSAIHISKLKTKLERNFTEPEYKLIEEKLQDAESADLNDLEEKKLKNRFDTIMKKYEKKINRVPFDEEEEKSLHAAFYNWMQITGKELPPGLWVALEVGNVLGARAADAFTDK